MARRAVVFDLDGTVADTIGLIVHALNETLADVWPTRRTLAEIRPLFGPPDDELIRRALPPDRDPARYVERYYEVYARELPRLAYVFPGVNEVLAELAEEGVALGLLTNKARRAAVLTLEAFGLAGRFAAVVSGSEAPPKPDPGGLRLVLERLGVAEQDAWLVGDSPADILAARAAGVRAVAALWGRTYPVERLLAALPDCQVADPAALTALVRA